MRYLVAFVNILFLATALIAFPRPARSAGDGPPRPDVTVSLAVVEGNISTASAFHVIIQNTSDAPQNHFNEWNSWGYGNLTLEWTDARGRTGIVAKVPGSWDKNFPSTTIVKPAEALVREISFDPKLWQGWPPITNSTTLTLKVTYHSTGEPKVSGSAIGWTGIVVSKAQAVIIWRPTTP